LDNKLNDDGIKTLKRVATVFFVVLFLYITGFGGCMMVRQKGGPWVVFEAVDSNGVPVVKITHHLRLTNGPVTLLFPGEKIGNLPVRSEPLGYSRVFRAPNTNDMPYGPVHFVDVTFLPGTVAFDVFGHLVEIQPRTLYLDGHETPWVSGTNIMLRPQDKMPTSQRPKR
jgi:hypothetical protein